jgi:hypothetical protein
MADAPTRKPLPPVSWPRNVFAWTALILFIPPTLPVLLIALAAIRIRSSYERQIEWRLFFNTILKRLDLQLGGWLGLLFTGLFALAVTMQFVGPDLDMATVWRAFRPWWGQVVGVFVVTATALGLYLMRDRRPLLYASLEVVVAEITIWSTFGPGNRTTLERGLRIAAGLYLLVRGFDNWSNGPERSKRTAEGRATRALERAARRQSRLKAAADFENRIREARIRYLSADASSEPPPVSGALEDERREDG